MIKNVTKDDFEKIKMENQITLVDFWAEWCGPCRVIAPILDEISKKNENVTIAKVNVDENSDLSMEFGIRNIPTLLYMKDGVPIDKHVGVKSEIEIQEKINSLIG